MGEGGDKANLTWLVDGEEQEVEQEGGVVDLLLDWKERNMTEGQGVMVTRVV